MAGQVFDTRGAVLSYATVEVWQTDHLGHYDLDGYRYRTTLITDADGKYSLESVIPGHYPDRVCQHIHYLVRYLKAIPTITTRVMPSCKAGS